MSRNNNDLPAVSILMSVYREEEEWLCASIDSMLNQSFSDFEFIIVNDNPERDLNEKIISTYASKDKRIVYIKNDTNLGLTKSLNIGMKKARGNYIARMDADDISMPTRIAEQFSFMEINKNTVVCGTWAYSFGNGIKSKQIIRPHKSKNLIDNYCIQTPIMHPTAFMRKSFLLKNEIQYNEEILKSQDRRLWLDIIKKGGSFANIQQFLLKLRQSDQQISSKNIKEQRLYSKKNKREFITYQFQQLDVLSEITPIPQIITQEYIRKIRKTEKTVKNNKNYSKGCYNSIKMVFYLSINSFNFITVCSYLFSFDYFGKPYSLRQFFVVLIKLLIPKRRYNRI